MLTDDQIKSQKSIQEKLYLKHFQNPNYQRSNLEISLPVVFHLFHNNGPENISDALILQNLEYLNQAFGNSGLFEDDLGKDSQIRFCLAKRDEMGNEFSGIIRYESIFTDMSNFGGLILCNQRNLILPFTSIYKL